MVSFGMTLYHMVLGAQDSTTGQYKRGYTILSVTMIIYPPGTSVTISGHGIYSGRNSVGITNNVLEEGDVVKDTLGLTYRVVGIRPHTWGDTHVFDAVDLQEIAKIDVRLPTEGSPVSDPNFFGFESITPGAVEFEDGFERGYFV